MFGIFKSSGTFKTNISFKINSRDSQKSDGNDESPRTRWSEIVDNFFENCLSGVWLYVAGSLIDFDFVCWCLRGPACYALSNITNRGLSLQGVRQTNKQCNFSHAKGHTEDKCWKKFPHKAPQWIRDKIKKEKSGSKTDGAEVMLDFQQACC